MTITIAASTCSGARDGTFGFEEFRRDVEDGGPGRPVKAMWGSPTVMIAARGRNERGLMAERGGRRV